MLNLSSGELKSIWSSETQSKKESVEGFSFDSYGTQLTLITSNEKDRNEDIKVWYYRKGLQKAVVKADGQSKDIEPGLKISNSVPYFNSNGQYIFFKLQTRTDEFQQKSDPVKVDIWSYRDSVTQFTQIFQKQSPWLNNKREYLAVVNIDENKIVTILFDDEKFAERIQGEQRTDNGEFIVVSDKVSIQEPWWKSERSTYLVSLKTGFRQKLSNKQLELYFFSRIINIYVGSIELIKITIA